MEKSTTVFVTAEVEVTVRDAEVVERVTGPGGDEWRANFYELHTEQEVLGHFARNHILNGVEQVSQLEGWGDAAKDAVTFIRVSENVDVDAT